jgi:hypothetical protein
MAIEAEPVTINLMDGSKSAKYFEDENAGGKLHSSAL